MHNGEYKRTVESYVATTIKLGELLAFGSTLMEPILAALQPVVTLQVYVGMNEAARRPHDLLYADKVVSVIMIDGCSFGSLKKWLAQNQLIPVGQAYTTSSNELVDMMNSGSFAPDASKQKQKKGKKKVDDETVGAIIESVGESSPVDTPSVECDPTVDDDPESEDSSSLDASVFSVHEESHT